MWRSRSNSLPDRERVDASLAARRGRSARLPLPQVTAGATRGNLWSEGRPTSGLQAAAGTPLDGRPAAGQWAVLLVRLAGEHQRGGWHRAAPESAAALFLLSLVFGALTVRGATSWQAEILLRRKRCATGVKQCGSRRQATRYPARAVTTPTQVGRGALRAGTLLCNKFTPRARSGRSDDAVWRGSCCY